MEIRQPKNLQNIELPLHLNISFEKVYDMLRGYASEEQRNHPFFASATILVKEVEKHPELINGFSDFSLLEKHDEIINLLLEGLFPIALTDNEIKAATIPFTFTSFKFTNRFENIIKN